MLRGLEIIVCDRGFEKRAVGVHRSRALEHDLALVARTAGGFFSSSVGRIQPPLHVEFGNRLAAYYGLDRDETPVIEARGERVRDWVAGAAARHVLGLIKNLSENTKRVGIALGGGGTVNRVAISLAGYLRNTFQPPSLRSHALTPGFNVFRPETAPLSSFGYFHGIDCDIERVDLFAPAAVPVET